MSKYVFHGTELLEDNSRHDTKLSIQKGTFELNGSFQIEIFASTVVEDSDVFISLKTFNGTPGFAPVVVKRNPHLSFIVTGSHGDLSTYNFSIFTYTTMIEKE